MEKVVYLSLGSNVGDRAANLRAGIDSLAEYGKVKQVSSFYETEPVDNTAQPWFLNCVVELHTGKMPKQLLHAVLQIERAQGRHRQKDQAKGPRTLDIDVLLFARSVINSPELTVPHPAMHQRRFVLQPLVEIAPEVRHPVFKKTARELLVALPPGQAVRKAEATE